MSFSVIPIGFDYNDVERYVYPILPILAFVVLGATWLASL